MTTRIHYGKYVDSSTPIVGVFSNNDLSLWDEADAGSDPEFLTALEALLEENPGSTEEEFCDGYRQSIACIGFREAGEPQREDWQIDTTAPYSAIVEYQVLFNCTQVVHSHWLIRCALCSPCFPGQADANTPGEYLAYSVPPDAIDDEELRTRVFNATRIDTREEFLCTL